jgi:heterodisulfide reductase subunit B
VGKKELLYPASGNVNSCSHCEISMEVSQKKNKVKIEIKNRIPI